MKVLCNLYNTEQLKNMLLITEQVNTIGMRVYKRPIYCSKNSGYLL